MHKITKAKFLSSYHLVSLCPKKKKKPILKSASDCDFTPLLIPWVWLRVFVSRRFCMYKILYVSYRCSSQTSKCNEQPCNSVGTAECVNYDNIRRICKCKAGYTGQDCETNIGECSLVTVIRNLWRFWVPFLKICFYIIFFMLKRVPTTCYANIITRLFLWNREHENTLIYCLKNLSVFNW